MPLKLTSQVPMINLVHHFNKTKLSLNPGLMNILEYVPQKQNLSP